MDVWHKYSQTVGYVVFLSSLTYEHSRIQSRAQSSAQGGAQPLAEGFLGARWRWAGVSAELRESVGCHSSSSKSSPYSPLQNHDTTHKTAHDCLLLGITVNWSNPQASRLISVWLHLLASSPSMRFLCMGRRPFLLRVDPALLLQLPLVMDMRSSSPPISREFL